MMRKPHSFPNYDDPIEWLTPPEYYHAPLQTGDHIIPVAANVSRVTFRVKTGPNGPSIIVIVRRGGV
ncbi:hypothetical protein FJ934_14340 [Mesorhizobium sp. B2-4-12]|uniref:hypothetical protein n=1 Tax=Mesorhizobium sp. B2-4-12 TaxID=2589937 RepID=UPI00112AF0F6|nr:hypothetical protein [Mesorhizobium sp. B2-4-12]TPK94788.1 hypothetical protein FJ934_14340 [Mesorhizobium sp. B2-4-12]